jgi:hypothetical protein
VQINREDSDLKVNDLFYNNEISFNYDHSLINEQNYINSIFSVPIDPHNDIIIKNSFLIAFVNLELLSDLNIPIVSVYLIREKDFLKWNKD